MKFKKIIGCLIFLFLIIIILLFILFGENSLKLWFDLKSQNNLLLKDLSKLELEQKKLSDNIDNLKEKSFYTEQIARENLQMANPKDHIFLIIK
jgi:cell division protein FtsB